MHSARVSFLGTINFAATLADLPYKLYITDYSVLYHVYDTGCFALVEWLLEGLGVFCLVPLCLLVSPILLVFSRLCCQLFPPGYSFVACLGFKWQVIDRSSH